jgi:peptide methionine sulfoxide reductase MsrB
MQKKKHMVSKSAEKEKWKKRLALDQYEVCWNKGSELRLLASITRLRTKGYTNASAVGLAACSALIQDSTLGRSATPIKDGDSVKKEVDRSYGMARTEVVIYMKCGAHPEHLFDTVWHRLDRPQMLHQLPVVFACRRCRGR